MLLGNYTHILKVVLCREYSREEGAEILSVVDEFLASAAPTPVQGVPMYIRWWATNATKDTYRANVELFTDLAVKLHGNVLLQQVKKRLIEAIPTTSAGSADYISFTIIKPLSRTMVLT